MFDVFGEASTQWMHGGLSQCAVETGRMKANVFAKSSQQLGVLAYGKQTDVSRRVVVITPFKYCEVGK
jgi:hypothetical protein